MKNDKDSYWFPHDSNARNDPKVLRLRRILGIEGYGIYFMLVEILRDQPGYSYKLAGVEDLAYEWHISREKILSVITEFDLFKVSDDAFFFSDSLINRMQPWDIKRLKQSVGGKKGAKIRTENMRSLQASVDDGSQGNPQGNPQGKLKQEEKRREENRTEETKLIKEEIDFEFKSEQDKELYELLVLKGLHPGKAINCFNNPERRRTLYGWYAEKQSGGKQRQLKEVTPRSPESEKLIRTLFGAMKSKGHRI